MSLNDDKLIKMGHKVLKKVYYKDILSSAQEILKEAKDQAIGGEDEDDIDEDAIDEFISERIHEEADGSEWVIYTGKAIEVMYASDSWLSIEDLYNEWPTKEMDITKMITMMAYCAYEQDLRECIDRIRSE